MVRGSRTLVLKDTTRLSLVHVTRADNTDQRKVGWSGAQRCQELQKEDIFRFLHTLGDKHINASMRSDFFVLNNVRRAQKVSSSFT